jgi:hypothetical protein
MKTESKNENSQFRGYENSASGGPYIGEALTSAGKSHVRRNQHIVPTFYSKLGIQTISTKVQKQYSSPYFKA